MSAPEVRILTVRQPWAHAIIHLGKDVENRVRNIAGDYRGTVAIHAGLSRFEDVGQYWEVSRAIRSEELGWRASDGEVWAADAIDTDDPRFAFGAIIGVVDLIDVHHHDQPRGCYQASDVLGWVPADGSDASVDGWTPCVCSRWANSDAFHLVFANPRPLVEPIPYRGAQGLRRLPDEVAAAVMEGVTS